MGLLLDVGYAMGVVVASPFLLFKFATDREYRRGLGERLGGIPKRDGDRPCLWLHCSSVGEVTLARPLVRELQTRRPDVEINISTMTPAGRDHAEKVFPGTRVHFYPLDFTFCVRRALRRVRPTAVVLVELEVWPNFIRGARRRHIPVAIINGRMSHRSHRRYRRLIWYFRPIFRRLTRVGVQAEGYRDRLSEFGLADRVTVTGNLKFDAAIDFDPSVADREVRTRFGLAPDDPLLVGGSTHDPEEKILCDTYLALRRSIPRLRLLIAPRHIDRAEEVCKVVEKSGLVPARRSQLTAPPPADQVLVLDTVGELAKVYAAANAVFIGGTFCSRGGQNMLEPAALGKPVVSGPSLANFEEISHGLGKAGGMKILQNPGDLIPALEELLKNPEAARAVGARGRAVVDSGRGALKATADLVCDLLKPGAPN